MLGRQTAVGGLMMVGARVISRVLDLATMLVLARILRPNDFGLVAIAMSLVSILEAVLELPVNQALLCQQDITRAHYDTAFTLSMLRGLVLSAVLVLAAWPFARIYGDDRLVWLVCILSLGPASRGLASPCLVRFQKNMSFWRDFIIELCGKLLGFTVSVGVAVLTGSYWSIAAGIVAFPVAMMIVSYCLAPYRPRLSLGELRVFSSFLGWMSAAQVFSAVNWQSERLLLGKLRSNAELGLFSAANDMSNIPTLALFVPIQRPLLAAFSKVQTDLPRLARSYQTACCAIAAIGLPVLVGESLVAEPAVRLVLGEKWLGAIPLLRWLSLSLIPALFTLPSIPLVMTFNQTKVFFRRNMLECCIKMPLLLVGAIGFGFAGVIGARVIAEISADLFSMLVVRRLLGLSVRQQMFVSWRSMVATLVMVPPVMVALSVTRPDAGLIDTGVSLCAAVSAGAAAYLLASWVLWVLSGRPAGIEATALGALSGMFPRKLRTTA
jgi:PST family polysaccharide transporter